MGTILEAARPYGMLILGCNTVGHLGAGLMHLQRTGDDTSGLMWERTLRFGVNTLAFRMPQHRAFFDIDADCIGISGRIDWQYNRQWGELLAGSGTSLFYSLKPDTLPPEQEPSTGWRPRCRRTGKRTQGNSTTAGTSPGGCGWPAGPDPSGRRSGERSARIWAEKRPACRIEKELDRSKRL